LGSEYPIPEYRETVEKIFKTESISWYGHSEMVILAYEKKKKYNYVPFQKYGYCESKKINGKHHLLGTSYYNYMHPFIRYDTEDLIEPVDKTNDILTSFNIKEGRIGDFVIDKKNNNISLTSLIFGRHPKIFEIADFVQVYQDTPGKIIIYCVIPSREGNYNLENLLDFSNVEIDYKVKEIENPIRNQTGKINLMLNEKYEEDK